MFVFFVVVKRLLLDHSSAVGHCRRHRQKILAQVSPLSNFCKAFRRAVLYSWEQFFWMHKHPHADGVLEDELSADLRWAQGRKLSMAHGKTPLSATDADKDENWQDLVPQLDSGGPWYKALTRTEFDNLLEYSWKYPRQAWQLNQSATEHAQASNRQYLHTLIRNCGLIFSEAEGIKPPRWLSPSELSLGNVREESLFSLVRKMCVSAVLPSWL